MMTFEEFLTKKKIDLVQFEKAEPEVFLEFRNNYAQMGEKSFDHSKKFWFNKLRRSYHLPEVPKPARESTEVNQVAAQAAPLISPSVEATGYTPRFKAKTPAGVTGNTAVPEPAQANTEAKPAYKPRFKAPASAPTEPTLNEQAEKKEASETIKPAYKPRFKAPVTPPAEAEPEQPAAEPAAPKPYKPRFKADIAASGQQAAEEKTHTEQGDSGSEANAAAEEPKPAYKPRFKPSIVKKKEDPGE